MLGGADEGWIWNAVLILRNFWSFVFLHLSLVISVQELRLARNELNGTIPSTLRRKVRILDLGGNKLTGEIPPEPGIGLGIGESVSELIR